MERRKYIDTSTHPKTIQYLSFVSVLVGRYCLPLISPLKNTLYKFSSSINLPWRNTLLFRVKRELQHHNAVHIVESNFSTVSREYIWMLTEDVKANKTALVEKSIHQKAAFRNKILFTLSLRRLMWGDAALFPPSSLRRTIFSSCLYFLRNSSRSFTRKMGTLISMKI